MSSIFTKIINGEIPCYKVAESQTHIAFLDINPITKGHTLVVPKKEIDYLFDLPDQLLGDSIVFAKKVANGIDKSLGTIRTGIIVEGLEVPHAHIHLVPIYNELQDVSLRAEKLTFSESAMRKIAKQIEAEVKI